MFEGFWIRWKELRTVAILLVEALELSSIWEAAELRFHIFWQLTEFDEVRTWVKNVGSRRRRDKLLPTTTYYYLLLPTTTYYYLLLPTTTYYYLLLPATTTTTTTPATTTTTTTTTFGFVASILFRGTHVHLPRLSWDMFSAVADCQQLCDFAFSRLKLRES